METSASALAGKFRFTGLKLDKQDVKWDQKTGSEVSMNYIVHKNNQTIIIFL